MKAQNQRLYYIDWLRILAFALLILFHCWRPFDHYPWNIKNAEQSSIFDFLTFFFHGWRMDLIFFVSGVGTWFALKSRGNNFYLDRIKRLIVPFIFGIILIIPPQKFIEGINFHGFTGNFIDFLNVYPSIMFSFNFGASILYWFGHLGAHIYYLPYLFTMSILFIPVYKILTTKFVASKLDRIVCSRWGIFLLILPPFVMRVILKPIFPGYTDWADFLIYICMFIYGFILGNNLKFTEALKKNNVILLITSLVSTGLLFYLIISNKSLMSVYTIPVFGTSHLIISFLSTCVTFSWVMFWIGLAAKKLNFNHKLLQVANEAILPVYILHQTIIVVFGYFIIKWNLPIIEKYILIASITVIFSLLIYAIIKRINFTRFIFGMKPLKNEKRLAHSTDIITAAAKYF